MLMIFKIERKKSKNQNFFDLPKFLKSKNYSEAFAKKHIVHPESKQMLLKSQILIDEIIRIQKKFSLLIL